MLKLAEYLQHAAECRELARTTASPDHRTQLENMAVTWESLAELRKQRLDRKADLTQMKIDNCAGNQPHANRRWRILRRNGWRTSIDPAFIYRACCR
jgi:hypothetical protein